MPARSAPHLAPLRRQCLFLALAIVLCLPFSVARAASPPQAPLAHSEPRLGRAAATQQLAVAIALMPSTGALDAFLGRVTDPHSPDYHHYLTPAAFTQRFVDAAARRDVTAFLASQGLSVQDSGVGVIVSARGSVAQIEHAFRVELDTYRALDGSTFVAPDRTPALPATLAPRLLGVIGLDTSQRFVSHLLPGPTAPIRAQLPAARTGTDCAGAQAAVTQAHAAGYLAYTPDQIATAYNFDALHTTGFSGEGQTVALFELAPFYDMDVALWKSCFPSTTPITRIDVDGGNTTGAFDESELDIDVILGLAPRLTSLRVYNAPNTSVNLLDEYQQIANDNVPIVSTSWGTCEAANPVGSAENVIFQQMAAQGMTLFAASGDDGTNACRDRTARTLTVDDPASQPYVSGVGGTQLTLDGRNDDQREVAWNAQDHAGGGGLSNSWPRPTWQSGATVTNAYSNGERQVPDVAANADPGTGYVIMTNGFWQVLGGTSAGAPLWAAGTALVSQALVANGQPRIGFANPLWYRLLSRPTPPYHDVTNGTNCVVPSPCQPDTYPATSGYDLVTGVGAPDFGAITAALLSTTALDTIVPDAGPATGGTTVTITGANFHPGIVVRFGNEPATAVTVKDSATLTAVTPAQALAGPIAVTVENLSDSVPSGSIAFTITIPPAPPVHATVATVAPPVTPNAIVPTRPVATVYGLNSTPRPQPIPH